MGNELLLVRLLTAINAMVDHDALDLLQAELSLDIQRAAPSIKQQTHIGICRTNHYGNDAKQNKNTIRSIGCNKLIQALVRTRQTRIFLSSRCELQL